MSIDTAVLNATLPNADWLDTALGRLPGTRPLDPEHWLCVDDAFAGQMALRDRLLDDHSDAVHAQMPEAHAAGVEALDLVLDAVRSDPRYAVGTRMVTRPDGTKVSLDRSDPLVTIGRLVQEDVCILQKGPGGEHGLTGAVLCFPASWTLSEKVGRPLTGLHAPIDAYTDDLARRVQRMFDNMHPHLILMRGNALLYKTPMLFAPRSEAEHDGDTDPNGEYLRSERQTLRRLPISNAVMFTIHTFVVRISDLTPDQKRRLDQRGSKISDL